MLVLGDSVVWGQGLNEKYKFYSIVKDRLEREVLAGRKVCQLNLSHSGAAILPKRKSCPVLPGEVPIGTPTIYAQSEAALAAYAAVGIKPEEVDLILLNGGINDIGFPTIVNPFTSEKKIVQSSRKFCFKEMVTLLTTLHEKFPKAQLVVTGYFPIISHATNPKFLTDLIKAFFGLPKGEEILVKSNKRQREQLKRATRLNDEELKRSNWLIDRLSLLSDLWKTHSDADLQDAVNTVNALPQFKETKPAVFVKVNFSPEECYAASETNFWQITGSSGGLGHFVTDDQLFLERGETCRTIAGELNLHTKLICPVAGTGHPNLRGEKKYADAIVQALTPLLSQR